METGSIHRSTEIREEDWSADAEDRNLEQTQSPTHQTQTDQTQGIYSQSGGGEVEWCELQGSCQGGHRRR